MEDAKDTNICLCEGLPGRVPPQPLTSTPSAAQPQGHSKEIFSKKREWGKLPNDSKQFLRIFFFSLEWKRWHRGAGTFIKWWEICYEWWKTQKSTETQIHCPWPSTIRVFIQPPSLHTQNKKRTSSELSTRANSWEHLCEEDLVKGWKSSVMIPPFLRYIKDKMDKDPPCPNSGQSKLDDNCGCYSFKRKGRRTQQLRPAPLLMQKWPGWATRSPPNSACKPLPPSPSRQLFILQKWVTQFCFGIKIYMLVPPQHHFFPPLITENKTFLNAPTPSTQRYSWWASSSIHPPPSTWSPHLNLAMRAVQGGVVIHLMRLSHLTHWKTRALRANPTPPIRLEDKNKVQVPLELKRQCLSYCRYLMFDSVKFTVLSQQARCLRASW